jgi:hypothetical protein
MSYLKIGGVGSASAHRRLDGHQKLRRTAGLRIMRGVGEHVEHDVTEHLIALPHRDRFIGGIRAADTKVAVEQHHANVGGLGRHCGSKRIEAMLVTHSRHAPIRGHAGFYPL